MATLSIFYVFIVTLFTSVFRTQAWEICNAFESDAFTCYDTYYVVGYCCSYYDFDYHECCSYTKVWTLWYFWIGMVFALIFFGAIIGCCKKMLQTKQQNKPVAQPNTALATVTAQSYPQEQVNTEIKLDPLPTYEQLEVETINNQLTNNYSNTGNLGDSTSVPYPYHQQPYPAASVPAATPL